MGAEVNPFWSERIREHVAVQQARPIDLPVPSEAEDLEALAGEQSVPVEPHREPMSVTTKETQLGKGRGERFSTPASWDEEGSQKVRDQHEGQRSEGLMPSEAVESSVQVQSQSVEDELQRALEREVVEKLHQENLQLKLQLEHLKSNQRNVVGSGTEHSWPEVSHGDSKSGLPPPPPPRSRSPTRRSTRTQDQRFTPQGTRVPDTSPPPDVEVLSEVPPWPFGVTDYEQSDERMFCGRTWGPSLRGRIREGPQVGLHDRGELRGAGFPSGHGVCRGGAKLPMGQEEGRGELTQPQSRGEQHLEEEDEQFQSFLSDDAVTAAAAREAWLKRELATLQSRMERETRGSGCRLTSDYWKQPVSRQEQQLGREGRWGVCQQAPLGRASYEGDCGQAPQSRADLDGSLGGEQSRHRGHGQEGDRAWHRDSGLSGDRAKQDCGTGSDRAQQYSRQGGDRAWHGQHDVGERSLNQGAGDGNGVHQDQGGNHRTLRGPPSYI